MAEQSGEYQARRWPGSPEHLGRLFATVAASGDQAALTRLTECVAELNLVQAAERDLHAVNAVEVGEASAQHRNSLRGAP